MQTYPHLNRDQFYVSGYFEPRLENRRDPKVHSCVWLNWANPHCNWIPSLFMTNCHLGPDECTFCVSTMAMQGVSACKVIKNLMQEIVVWRWVSNILCAVKISSTCDNFIEHLTRWRCSTCSTWDTLWSTLTRLSLYRPIAFHHIPQSILYQDEASSAFLRFHRLLWGNNSHPIPCQAGQDVGAQKHGVTQVLITCLVSDGCLMNVCQEILEGSSCGQHWRLLQLMRQERCESWNEALVWDMLPLSQIGSNFMLLTCFTNIIHI